MSVMDSVIDLCNEHPYLWGIYPIILVLPFVLVVAFCVPLREQTDRGRTQRSSSRVSSRKNTNDGTSNNNNGRGAADANNVRYLVRRGDAGNATDDEQDQVQVQQKWTFPPVLDDFNLMDSEVDPGELETMFTDSRLIQVEVNLTSGKGLGLTIVGGQGSANGDVPIYVKRILPDSVLAKDGRLKTGDELIAVNDKVLVNTTKDYATQALCNAEGNVRLLALQDL